MLKVSFGRLKSTCDTRVIQFNIYTILYARAALAWTKRRPKKTKRSLNEKRKANRASETEEQGKERLRISHEKIEKEGEPKNYKRKRNGRQKQKTTRNSAWSLSKD